MNLVMFNEPPYAERHVRWCERSENKIGGKLFYFPPTRFNLTEIFIVVPLRMPDLVHHTTIFRYSEY